MSTTTAALRIADVARRTGVPATTLRYYEDVGLLAPARASNGYRAYTERDVARIRFLTRARRLDLTLDDLRVLVAAWDARECGDVRDAMAVVVSTRLEQARARIAELTRLADELDGALRRLDRPARPGSCDDGCVCVAASDGASGPRPVHLDRGGPR